MRRPAPNAGKKVPRVFSIFSSCSVALYATKPKWPCAEPAWTRAESPIRNWRTEPAEARSPNWRPGRNGPTKWGDFDMSRTALILGAGLGGLVAAETLRKLLPAADRVIAVDRAERHFFPPSLLWLMVGEGNPGDFTRSLDRLIGRGVEVRHGEGTRIDAQRREIEIAGEPLAADALVIALGAEYAPEAIPGLAQAGLNLYTMDAAITIHDT